MINHGGFGRVTCLDALFLAFLAWTCRWTPTWAGSETSVQVLSKQFSTEKGSSLRLKHVVFFSLGWNSLTLWQHMFWFSDSDQCLTYPMGSSFFLKLMFFFRVCTLFCVVVQLTCLFAPLVIQVLPLHRKCLISGKSHSKRGWFQKSTWRRDNCGHSLEWQLALSLVMVSFFVWMSITFLEYYHSVFQKTLTFMFRKEEKSLPYSKGHFITSGIPTRAVCQNTPGSAEPNWAWMLHWFELICISKIQWEQKSFYQWLHGVKKEDFPKVLYHTVFSKEALRKAAALGSW